MHNRSLYKTIKCTDKFVVRVLIDNVSGLNIFPLSTLTQLNYDVGIFFKNSINVRAFDGAQRVTIMRVDLSMKIEQCHDRRVLPTCNWRDDLKKIMHIFLCSRVIL